MLSNDDLADALRECVTTHRPRLDTGQGIKMLYSDRASLSKPYWTVGLNPGGGHTEPDQWERAPGEHDYRDGYLLPETAKLRQGGLRLRTQLSAMVGWLGIDWSDTLSLNLVPFRSRDWDSMSRAWRSQALEFARTEFWPLLLRHRTPELVVCFGKESAQVLRQLLPHPEPVSYPVGWGKITADISEGRETVVMRLPHLSRFTIFGRPGGASALAEIRRSPAVERVLGPATQA